MSRAVALVSASDARDEIALALDLADGQRQIAAHLEPTLTGRQRQAMEARAALLGWCDQKVARGYPLGAAYEETAVEACAGRLPPDLQALVALANDRSGGDARLSARTLRRWATDRKKLGSAGVAPMKTRDPDAAPVWLDAFLRYYARPTKPSVADCLRQWAEDEPGRALPSYAAARLALSKLTHIERAQGREGRLALKARQAFVKRSVDDLSPGSVYVADGTTWDREVEHPIHGRPFKPEITTIIDAHTRRVVGWSAGLAESWQVVADALRRACAICIPAIFYTDRGSGYVNEAMNASLTGFLARLGVTPMRALPYNSQAKGNVERFQQRWVTLAKRAPTFTGAGMDKEAKQLAFKTTRKHIALVGRSPLLITWADFCGEVEAFVGAYNAAPHRGLPRQRDPVTGAKRHLSPNDQWAARVAAGFEPIVPSVAELDDLFRPYETRMVRRCGVQLGTNSYFDTALDRFHEQEVMVGYDMRDASRVWVREIEATRDGRIPGQLVCVARFEGNAARYVPVSMEQAAMERRAKGRLRRLQTHVSEVEAELRPTALLDLPPAPAASVDSLEFPKRETPSASSVGEEVASFAAAEGDAKGRPRFANDVEFARWIIAHANEATPTDREYAAELLGDNTMMELLRIKSVDLTLLRAVAVGEAA